ncbi:MAG: hypothetical protein ACREMV_07445 [Gemmatimonadales bacterium]
MPEQARWCRVPNEVLGLKPPWIWCDEPRRAPACGFLYFTLTAARELFERRPDAA